MPASSGQDGRVRSPLSLQEQLEHLHFHETPARCKSPCCSPLRPRESPSPKANRHQHHHNHQEQHNVARPALNRNAASHHTDKSSKSAYSTGTDGSSYAQSDDSNLPGYLTQYVDASTFEQIIEMDEDDDEREFSRGIVFDFFDQAEDTFRVMENSLKNRDLQDLSEKGHFLKGSSATLGLNKVRDACEKIQNFGAKKDETGSRPETDEDKCLAGCRENIGKARLHFHEAEKALKAFYGVDE